MRFSAVVSMLLLVASLAGCQSTESSGTGGGVSLGSSSTAPPVDSGHQTALPPNTAVMWVRGMGCPQCAYNVDRQLLKLPGVEDVKVDMGSGKVSARLSPSNPPTREQLAQAIVETGFTLKRIEMP